MVLSALSLQNDQMKVIEGNLMRARCLHSRLFFVSDRDTLCCMIPHASPLPILPLLRRCYPGVVDLGLVKMSSQDSLGQEDGMCVCVCACVCGVVCGVCVCVCVLVTTQPPTCFPSRLPRHIS